MLNEHSTVIGAGLAAYEFSSMCNTRFASDLSFVYRSFIPEFLNTASRAIYISEINEPMSDSASARFSFYIQDDREDHFDNTLDLGPSHFTNVNCVIWDGFTLRLIDAVESYSIASCTY